MSYIEETKRVVEEHKARHDPMSYTIPVEADTKCDRCHTIIARNTDSIHELHTSGLIEVLCGDACYMRVFHKDKERN